MVKCTGVVADVRVERLVRGRIRKFAELTDDVVGPGGCLDERARSFDRLAHDREVDGVPKQGWVDEPGVKWVRGV